MAALRPLALVAALALAGSVYGAGSSINNQFRVTFSVVPDPFHLFSFYTMPRTTEEAEKDHFAQVKDLSNSTLRVTIWCRNNDYRVCVLFDAQHSVAGIQVSASVAEQKKSKTPVNLTNEVQWSRQTFLGEDVYTTTALFVDPAVLAVGGRAMDNNTETAPEGIFIVENADTPVVSHVPIAESGAEPLGYTRQACFRGMGRHYFWGLKKDMDCQTSRPYFLLYGEKNKEMHGFGITAFGTTSQGRGWFETPPALVVKMIAPNGPQCLYDWASKYGIFTMHVFFNDHPWKERC